MAQVLFSTDTTCALADLDANFNELYRLRDLVSTPAHGSYSAYTAVNPQLTVDSSLRWGFGAAPSSNGSGTDNLSTAGSFGFMSQLNGRPGTGNPVELVNRSTSGTLNFYPNAATLGFRVNASGHMESGADNARTNGTASLRWSTVYAGTGTINTSDAREKTALTPLSSSEIAAASAIAREIGGFQFLDAVASKGSSARLHIGLTVQRVMEIMRKHDLDPLRYAFICHDSWPARVVPARMRNHENLLGADGAPQQVVEQPEQTIPAGDRYGFRESELLLFIARGFEARLAALESA